MNKIFPQLFYICFGLFFIMPEINFASTTDSNRKDNPVLANETSTPPKIDGVSDDSCWTLAKY